MNEVEKPTLRAKVISVLPYQFMDLYQVEVTLSCLGIGSNEIVALIEMIGKWIDIKESEE